MHFLALLALIFILVVLVKSLVIGLVVVAIFVAVRAITRPRSSRCFGARPSHRVIPCHEPHAHELRQPAHPARDLREVPAPRPCRPLPSWSLLAIGLVFFCLVALAFRVKDEMFASRPHSIPPKAVKKSRGPIRREMVPANPQPAPRPARVAEDEDQLVRLTPPLSDRVGPPGARGRSGNDVLGSWDVVGQDPEQVEDARQDALGKARNKVISYLLNRQPPIHWQPPDDFIQKKLVKVEKEAVREEAEPIGRYHEVTMHVEVTVKDLDEILRLDQQDRRGKQMLWLGEILAGVVALLLAIAGYIRLDEWTRGYYTGWLRLAALLLLGAIGASAWCFFHFGHPG
jgi:hypothetical protein